MAQRQIVVDPNFVAGACEQSHRMAADIAGSAGNQNLHVRSPRPRVKPCRRCAMRVEYAVCRQPRALCNIGETSPAGKSAEAGDKSPRRREAIRRLRRWPPAASHGMAWRTFAGASISHGRAASQIAQTGRRGQRRHRRTMDRVVRRLPAQRMPPVREHRGGLPPRLAPLLFLAGRTADRGSCRSRSWPTTPAGCTSANWRRPASRGTWRRYGCSSATCNSKDC